MNLKRFLFYSVIFLLATTTLAQTPFVDSLKSVLNSQQEDSTLINTHNLLGRELIKTGDYDKAMEQCNLALTMAERSGYKKGQSNAFNNIGIIFWYKGDYDKSIEFYLKSLKIREEIGDKKGIAGSYGNIGNIYLNKGEYDKALEFQLKGLKISQEINDKKLLTNAYNNLGETYRNKGDYAKAIDFYLKSLKIREELGDKSGVAFSYNNIGNIHYNKNEYDRAIDFFTKSLKIREELGDKNGIAVSNNNIGNVYYKKGNYNKAIEYYLKTSQIFEELDDKASMAASYNNIGNIYADKNDYVSAISYYTKSLKLEEKIDDKQGITRSLNNISNLYLKQGKVAEAKEQSLRSLNIALSIGAKNDMKESYKTLSRCDSAMGNFKSAFEYHKLYSAIKDSVFNESSNKTMAEMQTKYESEKKQKEIELQGAELEKKEAVIKQQTTQTLAFAGGFALVLILAGVSFNSYRNKRAAHANLEIKNKIIEEKNKDITDSINYAKTIQHAILPFEHRIANTLKDFFILFKPRDIVSGDFYWFTEKDNYIFISVADCTGHGVPGAFMSMIGSAALTHAVNERGITDTGKVLSEVNKKIKEALKQSENNNRDGMDIAILRFEKNNLHKVQFSSAMRPLYHINQKLNEIAGNKMPIGGTTTDDYEYTNHDLEVKTGDTLYMLSDGYSDQFGGPNGKKFMSGSLKKLLVSIQDKSMEEQKQQLNSTFEGWKGNLEQVDDVCVVGIKI